MGLNRLEGKVAIVTGAGQGIGRGIAEVFADEGATVIATATSPDHAFDNDLITYRAVDVSSEEGWKDLVAEVVKDHGKVDVLVNNAGIVQYEPIDELSTEVWRKLLAVNQDGVFFGMREVIPHMLEAGGGSIVNIASIWGNAGVAAAFAYQATKGAVRVMTKNVAVAYATRGIRCNSIHPGFIWTPLTHRQDPGMNDWVIGQTPMQRGGQPEDIAYGCVYLASDESHYVTGAELAIDGGYLAQ